MHWVGICPDVLAVVYTDGKWKEESKGMNLKKENVEEESGEAAGKTGNPLFFLTGVPVGLIQICFGPHHRQVSGLFSRAPISIPVVKQAIRDILRRRFKQFSACIPKRSSRSRIATRLKTSSDILAAINFPFGTGFLSSLRLGAQAQRRCDGEAEPLGLLLH